METDWSIDGWEYLALEMAKKAGHDITDITPHSIRMMSLVAKAPKTVMRVELGEIASVEEAYEAAKIELGVL